VRAAGRADDRARFRQADPVTSKDCRAQVIAQRGQGAARFTIVCADEQINGARFETNAFAFVDGFSGRTSAHGLGCIPNQGFGFECFGRLDPGEIGTAVVSTPDPCRDDLRVRRLQLDTGAGEPPDNPIDNHFEADVVFPDIAVQCGNAGRPDCTKNGTPGNDVIRGTPGDDVICARGGNDIVYGGGGNDTVFGGGGNDVLRGEGGNDTAFGGAGNDVVRGGGGNDGLLGEGGNDQVIGGAGDDKLSGGPGRDTLSGQQGSDRLDTRDGRSGNDGANGGPGSDGCDTDRHDTRSSC